MEMTPPLPNPKGVGRQKKMKINIFSTSFYLTNYIRCPAPRRMIELGTMEHAVVRQVSVERIFHLTNL
jgi:hypothetical protein